MKSSGVRPSAQYLTSAYGVHIGSQDNPHWLSSRTFACSWHVCPRCVRAQSMSCSASKLTNHVRNHPTLQSHWQCSVFPVGMFEATLLPRACVQCASHMLLQMETGQNKARTRACIEACRPVYVGALVILLARPPLCCMFNLVHWQ